MAAYIERLVVENFGCIKHVELRLTPLHAVIGPNDSGKSTLLAALGSVLRVAAGQPIARAFEAHSAIEAHHGSASIRYDASTKLVSALRDGSSQGHHLGNPAWMHPWRAEGDTPTGVLLRGARLLRLNARSLRQPSPLIPAGHAVDILDDTPLAGVLDAVFTQNVDNFISIRDDVRRLFPTISNLALRNLNPSVKSIVVTLRDGAEISANDLSDGILYFMAFRSLQYLSPASVVLLEEPENGLHPARIADVMAVLRVLSSSQQVVLATHSPLVVNELNADEVTVVTRTLEAGTRVTPIAETPNFEERKKVYSIGELWLSYANGRDEAPLLKGLAPSSDAAE